MERVKADNVEKLKNCHSILQTVLLAVMCATVILQIATYEKTRHLILCGIIIILCVTLLILDRRISDNGKSVMYGAWTLMWIVNFVVNLLAN